MSIKIRDFQKKLRGLGAVELRVTGSHQIWQLPSGKRVSLVLGRGELSRNVLHTFRLAFREAKLEVDF